MRRSSKELQGTANASHHITHRHPETSPGSTYMSYICVCQVEIPVTQFHSCPPPKHGLGAQRTFVGNRAPFGDGLYLQEFS